MQLADTGEPVWPLLIVTLLLLLIFGAYLYLRVKSAGIPFLPPPTAQEDTTA